MIGLFQSQVVLSMNLSYKKFSWSTTLSSFSQNVDERVKFYIEREWWNVFRAALKTTSSPVENKHFQVYFSHRLKLLNFFYYLVRKHVSSYCTKTAAFSICIEDSKKHFGKVFLLLGTIKPFLDDTFQSKIYILLLQ